MKRTTEPYLITRSLKVGLRNSSRKDFLFENLNLSLFPKKLVCFMGPNGIGKSSLIRTLANLQNPLAGFVDIIPERNIPLPEKLSVVLTDRITYGNMSVRELVTFGRYPFLDWSVKLSSEDLFIIDEALTKTQITHLADQEISQLSDGQMQMVMIARALAQNTSVILLDEPTAHLDLDNRVEIMRLLRSLAHDMNKAVLVATHELDLALQSADEIWLAGKNKNILTGIPEDLVLDGSFDEIFRFKGFDLKTGRLVHQVTKRLIVRLKGEGHAFLWTKNSLERNGFQVEAAHYEPSGNSGVTIEIVNENQRTGWILKRNGSLQKLNSIAGLLEIIGSIDCGIPE